MEPSDQELSPALEAARRRRLDLHDALIEVEEAISAPAPGRVHDWALAVGKRLVHLRDSFDEHIRGTEEQGGLYDDILHRAPHLAGKVKRLRDEHPMIQLGIAKNATKTPNVIQDGGTRMIPPYLLPRVEVLNSGRGTSAPTQVRHRDRSA